MNSWIERLGKKAAEIRAHLIFVQEAIAELLNLSGEKKRPTR